MKPVIIHILWQKSYDNLKASQKDYQDVLTWAASQGYRHEFSVPPNRLPINATALFVDSESWLSLLQVKYPNLIFKLHKDNG